ncbi:hypothetical protein D9V29_12360 [Mycetocola manganoxydans]|uniref:Uncharacterized protein n=1 Tax=Mycetocola manganoxydans TaxID=699879 RepID=A0A3L6ZN08_9MICO|nr:hypothetical protein [Mycetocola manganoxydans]RLP69045.1 hypothetical protein D9V29_12360 [Mycetocola manganoxydans]
MTHDNLGHAGVTYGDWLGTAAADEHQTIGHLNPYEVAGLDRDRWWILSIDITVVGVEKGYFYVYAVDREATSITDYEALQMYGRVHGKIPVTSFLVHDIAAETLIRESFTQFHVQLRHRSLGELPLAVEDTQDLNYTGD